MPSSVLQNVALVATAFAVSTNAQQFSGRGGSRGNRGSMRQFAQSSSQGIATTTSSGNSDWMATLKAKMQAKMEGKLEERADQLATLSVACADEVASCGLAFTPESVFADVLAFKSSQRAVGTRDPLPEDIQSKQEALKECFQSMKEELSALSELPQDNSCIEALRASRKHGKGKHHDKGHGKFKQLCADESRPACFDGQRPTFNRDTMSVVCSDGVSTPLCADGSAPQIPEDGFRGKGGKGDKLKQLCADESRPACFDGQRPTFNRDTMSVVCSDGVSTPLCADGSAPQIPEDGFRKGGSGRDRSDGFQQQGVFGLARMQQMQGSQWGQQRGARNRGQKPQRAWSTFGYPYNGN